MSQWLLRSRKDRRGWEREEGEEEKEKKEEEEEEEEEEGQELEVPSISGDSTPPPLMTIPSLESFLTLCGVSDQSAGFGCNQAER